MLHDAFERVEFERRVKSQRGLETAKHAFGWGGGEVLIKTHRQ